MMPLFVGLFGSVIIPHERWTLTHGIGVLAGLVGLVAIFRSELSATPGTFWPMMAIVVSAAAAAVASLVMRRWGADIHVFVLNGAAMFVGAAALLVAAMVRGERIGLPAGASAWWSVLYLSIFGSVVSFLLYIWLLRRWTANRVSLVTLVTPVVAVFAGFLVLGEKLTPLQWLGAMLVLGGVAVALFVPARGVKAEPV
jgi:drug/metabolite transporter (DMT)-like permease